MCCSMAAQLAVELGDGVGVARAGDLGVEGLRVGDAVCVVAEGAQAHGAEILVADGHRLGRAPALVDLLARAEEETSLLNGLWKSLSQFFR